MTSILVKQRELIEKNLRVKAGQFFLRQFEKEVNKLKIINFFQHNYGKLVCCCFKRVNSIWRNDEKDGVCVCR